MNTLKFYFSTFVFCFIALSNSEFQNGVTYRIRHYKYNQYLSINLDQMAVSFKQWKNDNRFKFLATNNYTSQFVLVSLDRGRNRGNYALDEHATLHYLQKYRKHGQSNQRWTAEPVADDTFLIRNEYSKNCIMFGFEEPHLIQECQKENVLFQWIIEESY